MESSPIKKRKRRILRRRILSVACGLLLLLTLWMAIDYWAFPYGASRDRRSFDRGENGLWLRYTWYFGQHSELERRQLAQKLQSRQFKSAFFHVRHIGKDGRLKFRYAVRAKVLTTELHRDCPDVKLIAWAYVSDMPPSRAVHLKDRKTRQVMVAEARWLVNDCGFDGIQWDVEPSPEGDADFLALIRETKAALPSGKLLSVATPMWMPSSLSQFGWSDTYFTRVAANCDQIAVMCYDTGFYLPRAYVWVVRQQAIHVTRAVGVGNPRCRVLLGVPTYGTGLPSHNPHAENLEMALLGVREGLEDPGANGSVFAGVSLFADYTTSEQDWNRYKNIWLAPYSSRQ